MGKETPNCFFNVLKFLFTWSSQFGTSNFHQSEAHLPVGKRKTTGACASFRDGTNTRVPADLFGNNKHGILVKDICKSCMPKSGHCRDRATFECPQRCYDRLSSSYLSWLSARELVCYFDMYMIFNRRGSVNAWRSYMCLKRMWVFSFLAPRLLLQALAITACAFPTKRLWHDKNDTLNWTIYI